jgi:hypothetical protein
MIYSNKYGRYFHNRSELQRYTWKDARTKPILSWFGLRDHFYSKQWLYKYGLATQGERLTLLAVVVCVLGVALGSLLLLSEVADGIFFVGIGLLCIWGLTKEGRD